MLVGPGGEVLTRQEAVTTDPHMIVLTLEHRTLVDARSRFEYTYRFRRPELYAALAR
jgi:hypothetical protein